MASCPRPKSLLTAQLFLITHFFHRIDRLGGSSYCLDSLLSTALPINPNNSTMTTEPSSAPSRPVLPSRGVARVKNVLSGDTVVLLGKAAPGQPAPEVVFTFERVTAPRCVCLRLTLVVLDADNCWLLCSPYIHLFAM